MKIANKKLTITRPSQHAIKIPLPHSPFGGHHVVDKTLILQTRILRSAIRVLPGNLTAKLAKQSQRTLRKSFA
jgi:hypothetical protein